MALERRDRVRDQTTTTGTGTFTVAGSAPTGYRTITSAFTDGATVRYTVFTQDLTEWEVGQGVWTVSGTTLTRATIYASSNAGAAVNFSAGTKFILCGPVAADIAMLVADGQIAFPATQNASAGANTLDDYEEGTFTPTLAGSSTAGTQTYSAQVGRYTKIGHRVWLDIRIAITTKDGTTSGSLRINDLPFTSVNVANYRAAASFGGWSTLDINTAGGHTTVSGVTQNNVARIDLLECGDNNAAAALTEADFANGTVINTSISYEVA